jgi:hypothetical protein
MAHVRLGDLLLQKNLLKKEQLELALGEQALTKEFLGLILVRKNYVREEDLGRVLSEQFHIPLADLTKTKIQWEVAMQFTPSIVVDKQCLPISQDENSITVAILNPHNVEAISRIEEQAKGVNIKLVLALESQMRDALLTYNKKMAEKIQKMLDG